MAGSGLSDILLEAGLISSGSIDGVMTGRHYDRALHCHQVLVECLEQLLFEKYLSQKNDRNLLAFLSEDSQRKIQALVHSPSAETLSDAITDEGLMHFIDGYLQFKKDVAGGL